MYPRRYPIACNAYGFNGPCGAEDCKTCHPENFTEDQTQENKMDEELRYNVANQLDSLDNKLDLALEALNDNNRLNLVTAVDYMITELNSIKESLK